MKSASAIYSRFMDFEERAASIYLRMAARFSKENPDLSALWLELGMQEKQHSGLLQFCLSEELFATELPGEREMEEAHGLFVSLSRRVSEPGLTVSDAFEIACEMETCEVNTIYQRLTIPAHASAYLLRRKIATSMPDHLGELLRHAHKFDVNEKTLTLLEKASADGHREGERIRE